jgi:hypothetical protein
MTVSRHVEEAAARFQKAEVKISHARQGSDTCENQRVWLEALSEYCNTHADNHTLG